MENEIRWFQWVIGDKKGQTVIFSHIESEDGLVFICFKDGTRINEQLVGQLNEKSLTGKMMAEIDSPNNPWRFEEKIVGEESGRVEMDWESQTKYEIPSITEIQSDGKQLPKKTKVTSLIPPRPTPPKTSNFGIITNNMQEPLPVASPQQPIEIIKEALSTTKLDSTDPIAIMISKAKKIDHDVEMTISIAMPTKSLFNVADESFENGADTFVEYIIQNIDVKDIKEALKIAIMSMYKTNITN